jgi:hypothetical protein
LLGDESVSTFPSLLLRKMMSDIVHSYLYVRAGKSPQQQAIFVKKNMMTMYHPESENRLET